MSTASKRARHLRRERHRATLAMLARGAVLAVSPDMAPKLRAFADAAGVTLIVSRFLRPGSVATVAAPASGWAIGP